MTILPAHTIQLQRSCLAKEKGVLKCSSLPAWRVLLVSASLVICPEKISEILERLPRSAWEAGALAYELCHLMPSLHWDSASWICKPLQIQPSISKLPDRVAALWPLAGLPHSSPLLLKQPCHLLLPPLEFLSSRDSLLAPLCMLLSTGSRFIFFFKQFLRLAHLCVAVQTPLLKHS